MQCGRAARSAERFVLVACGLVLGALARVALPSPDRRQRDSPPPLSDLCRACGWDLGEPGWTAHGPSHLVCDCCGAEAGIDDATTELALDYRRRWIEGGFVWFDPEVRPDDWDLYAQLSSLGDQVLGPPDATA